MCRFITSHIVYQIQYRMCVREAVPVWPRPRSSAPGGGEQQLRGGGAGAAASARRISQQRDSGEAWTRCHQHRPGQPPCEHQPATSTTSHSRGHTGEPGGQGQGVGAVVCWLCAGCWCWCDRWLLVVAGCYSNEAQLSPEQPEQESGAWPPPSLLLARGISQMLEMNHTWVNMVTFVVDLNMWQLAEDANMLSEQLLIILTSQ